MDIIKEKLLALQDTKYKEFFIKLIPTVDPDTVIGIRAPKIRALAKEIKNESYTQEFLKSLPHGFLEENALHAAIICDIKDFESCIYELNRFLPYVDNWSVCDSMRPKCFKRNTDKLILEVNEWLASSGTYTVRFGIEMLMTYFLDEHFSAEQIKMVSNIRSDEYYINMMIAWYFATALAKQWESTVPYIEQKVLPLWVHNKTIQKAVESYRVTDSQKKYLREFKIKNAK